MLPQGREKKGEGRGEEGRGEGREGREEEGRYLTRRQEPFVIRMRHHLGQNVKVFLVYRQIMLSRTRGVGNIRKLWGTDDE